MGFFLRWLAHVNILINKLASFLPCSAYQTPPQSKLCGEVFPRVMARWRTKKGGGKTMNHSPQVKDESLGMKSSRPDAWSIYV
jgi:hypothetical protein